ncbi:hypothetical protein SAMN06265367_108153 [Algoriphagus winogradskyi]|uniref:Uncharacterized protein n=1 Tax=Algoriphagus winogradskyi TaxID=237017 RepID=A0ABY1PGG0_9BACT|nr:hypothetical protein SAMN06265367_108153 [Algoriphagus winogradskyi]
MKTVKVLDNQLSTNRGRKLTSYTNIANFNLLKLFMKGS